MKLPIRGLVVLLILSEPIHAASIGAQSAETARVKTAHGQSFVPVSAVGETSIGCLGIRLDGGPGERVVWRQGVTR